MNKPILLVEDNPDDVELTIRAFSKSNIANEIIVARDGEQALELLLGDKPVTPAVVLLDLKLPKIDGLEVLRRIRDSKETELLPVVILTSSREENDLVNGYRCGANSYIRKPVDFERFIEAVKTLGVYWLILNEPPPM
ncbi:MAG TPA: response regulator [Spirochaetota bacterium]|nr:response regulator [Spirochaetota bacterium]HOD13333.1 response regulator [Spirochaetota bacterium]HPG50836.1 response regulator [Spirochaetota bacterium]HPN12455.1 response regulator [Spirochaetota bacterium]HQL81413.1 response regulator [Spirochaetota bacterium]